MHKKNKIIVLLTVFILLLLLLNKILNIDTLSYELKKENNIFNIKQIKKDRYYYIEIRYDDDYYTFDFFDTNIKGKKLINDIYYYKDNNYKCILPVISSKIQSDMICLFKDTYYDYQKLPISNDKLDNYVSKINEYDSSKFIDDISSYKEVNSVKFYTKNNINKIVSITTYKGLINNLKSINLFKSDVYSNKISVFLDNYYLIADYDNNHEFEYFYLVDLKTNDVSKIKSNNKISLDSYIQGIVDNNVYLYDRDNEVQYEINILDRSINIVSNSTKIKYYKNNKWTYLSKIKANKELLFDYNDLSNNYSSYDYVKKTDNYYYLFKSNGSHYDLYRADINNDRIIKYISEVDSIDIYCNKNFIYYVNGDKLYYYSDETGMKTLLEYSELKFNNTIKFNVY